MRLAVRGQKKTSKKTSKKNFQNQSLLQEIPQHEQLPTRPEQNIITQISE
jgi:hypothetical protein